MNNPSEMRYKKNGSIAGGQVCILVMVRVSRVCLRYLELIM